MQVMISWKPYIITAWKHWTIIEQTNSDLSMLNRSFVCLSWRSRQIIDLHDTNKSWYFVKTKFRCFCFIIQSQSLIVFGQVDT